MVDLKMSFRWLMAVGAPKAVILNPRNLHDVKIIL
jgi:hypothetical protein